MRVIAGFEKEDGYFLPRSRCVPSDALQEMVWPWVETVWYYVLIDDEEHITAKSFLKFLQKLRIILLQDAAALFILCEDGRRLTHVIFETDLFQSSLFTVFVDEMRVILDQAEDPNNHAIDQVLPGVNRRMDALHQLLNNVNNGRVSFERNMSGMITSLKVDVRNDIQRLSHNNERLHRQLVYDNLNRHRQTLGKLSSVLRNGVAAMDEGIRSTLENDNNYGISRLRRNLDSYRRLSNNNNLRNTFGNHNNVDFDNNSILNNDNNTHDENVDMDINMNNSNIANNNTEGTNNMDNDNQDNHGNTIYEHNFVLDSLIQQNPPPSTQQSVVEEPDDELLRIRSGGGCYFSFRRTISKRLFLIPMYKEFFGIGEFSGKPIVGGFAALEEKYKNKWRKGIYSSADGVFFSRVKKLMSGLASASNVDEGELNELVTDEASEWQPILQEKGICGLLNQLQNEGVLNRKGTRRRTNHLEESPNVLDDNENVVDI